ncbi:MAG: hypothetical protein ACRD2Z_15980 [Thermoanaerobaculia bacterium]
MSEPSATPENLDTWWGARRLGEGRVARWRICGFELAICNWEGEWQVAWDASEAREDTDEEWTYREEDGPLEEAPNLERYIFREVDDALSVLPALADRAVVASPRIPVYLLPGEETRLYVGSPLWVQVAAQTPPRHLCEFPILRPTDTWFGPNNLAGELCYATHTRARVRVEKVPHHVRYAMTPLDIHNRADTPLRVERVKLPVPYLHLYAGSDGRLWTQTVTMTRSGDGDLVRVEAKRGAPREARPARKVQEARQQMQQSLLTRAFSTVSSIFERKEDED